MEVANILKNKEQGLIYGLMGDINITTNNIHYSLVTDFKFQGTVEEFLNSEKAAKSLKMVMLNPGYLSKNVEDLSEAEIKKVILAKSLIENKDYLVLDYFDKCLTYREKENYKRLFKKLAYEYHKTILIFTNDITFLWDLVDELIYVDNQDVVNNISKEDYYAIANFINKPEIMKFIELMRSKNIEIEDYKNVLDLLKAIYRLKEV